MICYRAWRTPTCRGFVRTCKTLESDGHRTGEVKPDDSRHSNVVPFPRDWIGPQEELVPFGLDSSPRPGDAAGGDTRVMERPAGANDFWDEGSWAIQHPLEGPPVGEAARDDARFDWEAQESWQRGSPGQRVSPRYWFTRAREMGVGQLAVIGAVALALLGLVAARFEGSSSSPTRPEAKAPSAAVRPPASALRGLRPHSTAVPSRTHGAARRHPAGRHRSSARHRAATTGRQSPGSTQVSQSAPQAGAAQPTGDQALQTSGSSPPPSSGSGQPVGHTATSASQTHSSPPTGPSGRHALLGPGVCGGCK